MKYCCKLLWIAALSAAVSSCVDDNYDLTDIDTTIGVTVDQLVIPVNIDEITLGDIISPDTTVQVIDGRYTIVKEGKFNSAVMNVPAIDLKAPAIRPSETTINLIGGGALSRAASSFTYDLANVPSEYRYESSLVSDFIVSIDHIGCDLSLKIDITLRGLESKVRKISLSDVVFQLPKGLDITADEGGTYDPVTGLMRMPDRVISGNKLTLQFAASGVNFIQADGKYDYDESSVSVTGSLFIKEGKATVSASDVTTSDATLPANVTLRTEYTLSDAHVTTFSGKVRYSISDSNLTDIDLSTLPDVLSQQSTDLTFVNPMVYLHITNPLQGYGLYARTGLEVTAFHGNNTDIYSLDNPWFQIGPEQNDGEYNFCLSPNMPETGDPDFAPATHVGFADLADVLSGNGIPDRLSISLIDPNIPTQNVKNFRLGTDLGALDGKYRFVAPLKFGAGSTIVYADTISGWMSEDLENLTIRSLEVSLTIDTDIPVEIDFTGYPIGTDGRQIGNVEITGANVDANASSQKVTIKITGEIRGLDGIRFEARAKATSGDALRPDMTIRLRDIRPRVSGYYEKEL